MAVINVTVCDVCEDPARPVEKWTLEGPEGEKVLDLCRVHRKPLVELMTKASAVAAPKRTPRKRAARGVGAKLTTISDIEQQKIN